MKRAIVIVAFVAAVLGAVAIRVVVEGRNALAAGDVSLQRGATGEAIRSYEAAARWYLPLAPHVDEAYAKLRELARSPEPAVSLAAWRAIRGAARATRSLWTPHASDLAAADEAISRISAGIPQAGTADPGWHRDRLAWDTRPSVGAATVAALGILLWLGGAILLVWRGIGPTGALIRSALIPAVAIILGLACWAGGLYNA